MPDTAISRKLNSKHAELLAALKKAEADANLDWFAVYKALPTNQQEFVIDGCTALRHSFRDVGIPRALDERHERLIGAVTRYMLESAGDANRYAKVV